MQKNEIWKPIEDYEGLYEISNYGRVKSLKHWRKNGTNGYWQDEKILKLNISENIKYLSVELYKKGKGKRMLVHRIVAKAFVANPKNNNVVNHIDGNRYNNCSNNLEWCTHKENIHHALITGIGTTGERNGKSKFTNQEVKRLRKIYIPYSCEFGMKALAQKHNVKVNTMNRILNYNTYKNI